MLRHEIIVEGDALTFLFEFKDGTFEFAGMQDGVSERYRESCHEQEE